MNYPSSNLLFIPTNHNTPDTAVAPNTATANTDGAASSNDSLEAYWYITVDNVWKLKGCNINVIGNSFNVSKYINNKALAVAGRNNGK